jgi:hypothetical protein
VVLIKLTQFNCHDEAHKKLQQCVYKTLMSWHETIMTYKSLGSAKVINDLFKNKFLMTLAKMGV